MAIVLGIDKFMSECRALTNLCGNGVACVVVSWWEGELDKDKLHANLNKQVDPSDVETAITTASDPLDANKNRRFWPGGFLFGLILTRRCRSAATTSRLAWLASPDVAGAGSAGAGAEDSTGSGALWLTEGAGSAGALVTKLTFSRTVERRRAAARSASCVVSSADGAGALATGSGRA